MTRVIGSLEIMASADAPAWMIGMLEEALKNAHNKKDVITRLWGTVPSSPLACECLGALYRTRAIQKAARAAQAPDTNVRTLSEAQYESNVWRWQHMYLPLAHWIHSRCAACFCSWFYFVLTAVPRSSRPCLGSDGPREDGGCELCIGVKLGDAAYLQMLSQAASKDMSGSKLSFADVLADSEARFTFRPALLLLEGTLGWTQTTTTLILADIVTCIEAQISTVQRNTASDFFPIGQRQTSRQLSEWSAPISRYSIPRSNILLLSHTVVGS
jgi:hypothetical protein